MSVPSQPLPEVQDAGLPAAGGMPARASGFWPWLSIACVLALILGAYVGWQRTHAVDPALVGRWTKGMQNQSGAWQATFTIGGNRRYRVETMVHDRGSLVATAGQFRMTSVTRTSAIGSYRVLDPASLEVTTRAGKVTWKRAAAPAANVASQPMLGVWEAWPVIGGITWHQTLTNTPDGSYTLASVTGDSGRLTASNGHWHMLSQRGRESDGTYQLTDPQSLVFTAPEGRSQWHRDTTQQGRGTAPGRE